MENAPQTIEEAQAVEVVNACAGQFRAAGMGAVTGIDLAVAITYAQARGYDTSILAELLASASHGIAEGIHAK